ncbi:hypothetical protein HanIR_Chr15g0782591 [Helianthus annuus]|nr:hypothetical protein HanIR_Chr15g0782591 [Helianthus annuus]
MDRFNRSAKIHHMNNRLGKKKHRSTEIHRNPNPKLERIELLKKVQELTDQLERTSVSNPHGNFVSSAFYCACVEINWKNVR